MKLKMFFMAVALFAASLMPMPALAAAGVAQIKGTYSFQVAGVSNSYGYYSGNTFVNLNNGGQCPKNMQCQQVAQEKITVGTINFNGAGIAKFLSIRSYDQGSNGGGPAVNVGYKYVVSGFNGTLTIPGAKGAIVSLSLGSYNAAGIATVVQFFVTDTNPSLGTAILQ